MPSPHSHTGNSKEIITDQDGLHPNLIPVVTKHLEHPFQKPIADRSRTTFDAIQTFISSHKHNGIILDSCCGVGESTRHIADAYPNHLVIGMDKSSHRLSKEGLPKLPDNAAVFRADLNDLFRLIANARLPITHHFLLYPNPWPKAAHLQRRWHGAPVFRDIVRIGGDIEIRSNWELYLEEFSSALAIAGKKSTVQRHKSKKAQTPFERKFSASGHPLWILNASL